MNLFSHEFFLCADDRTLASMLPADRGKRPGISRIRNMHAIPGQQKIHSMHRCNRDVRSIRSGLPGILPDARIRETLGGHPKTGQSWSLQNRPMGTSQDKS
jgi:hypothetical protein